MNTGERLRTKLRRTLSPPATPPIREKYRHLPAKPHTPRALAQGLRLRFRIKVDFAPEFGRRLQSPNATVPLGRISLITRDLQGNSAKQQGSTPERSWKTCVKSVGFAKFPYFRNRELPSTEQGIGFEKQGTGTPVSGSRFKPQCHRLLIPVQRNVRRYELCERQILRLPAFQGRSDNRG
jgi:hypothetical protein